MREPWVGNWQEEGPLSYFHPTLDLTTVAEEVPPVDHWVYGVAVRVAESKHPEVMAAVDRNLGLVRMAGGRLAGLQERRRLVVAVVVDCKRKRPSTLEVVVGNLRDFERAQHIWCQTFWLESP